MWHAFEFLLTLFHSPFAIFCLISSLKLQNRNNLSNRWLTGLLVVTLECSNELVLSLWDEVSDDLCIRMFNSFLSPVPHLWIRMLFFFRNRHIYYSISLSILSLSLSKLGFVM